MIKDNGEHYITQAVAIFSKRCPQVKEGVLTLKVGELSYEAPDDIISVRYHLWYDPRLERYAHTDLPNLSLVAGKLVLSHLPSAAQLADLGTNYRYSYRAKRNVEHLDEEAKALVLLKAKAEAMRTVAVHNANKPVQLRDGATNSPKNSTPSALRQIFLQEFEEGCRGYG